MNELAATIALGALASIAILAIAPLWLVYAAAFFGLTPVLALTIYFGRAYMRSLKVGVRSASRRDV